MTKAMEINRKTRVQWPAKLLYILVVVCVLAGGVYLAREYTSYRQVKKIKSELFALGYPMTADQRWQYHESNSQPYDQAEVNRFTSLSQHISGTQSLHELLPNHQASRSPHFKPASTRLQNDIEFAEIYRPVIQRLSSLELPNEPMRLDQTLVNRDLIWAKDSQRRQLFSLLEVAFDAAIRENQSDRALSLLSKIAQASRAWDWQLYLWSHYSYLSSQRFLYSVLQRSFSGDLWTAEQLQEIRDRYLGEIDYADRIQRGTLSELGEMLESNNSWYENVPSTQLRGYQHLLQVLDIARGPTSQIRERINNWHREDEADVWNDSFTVSDLAESTASSLRFSVLPMELDRRLTLLALATLQYELKHERWPQSFSDLEDVGIDSKIWSNELQADFRMIRQGDDVKLEYQEYAPLQKLNGLYQERPKPIEVLVR